VKSENFFVANLIALAVGILQTVLLLHSWEYIAVHSPVPSWLASHGVTAVSAKAILYAQDWLVNVTLCLPAAYILCRLRPSEIFQYLLLAMLPSFFWQGPLVVVDPAVVSNVMDVPVMLLAAFMLPVAVALVRLAQGRRDV